MCWARPTKDHLPDAQQGSAAQVGRQAQGGAETWTWLSWTLGSLLLPWEARLVDFPSTGTAPHYGWAPQNLQDSRASGLAHREDRPPGWPYTNLAISV